MPVADATIGPAAASGWVAEDELRILTNLSTAATASNGARQAGEALAADRCQDRVDGRSSRQLVGSRAPVLRVRAGLRRRGSAEVDVDATIDSGVRSCG